MRFHSNAVQRRRGEGGLSVRFHSNAVQRRRGGEGGAQRAIPFQRCAEEKGGGRAERAIPFQRCAEEKRGGGGLSVRFHSNAVQRRRGGGLACDSIPTLCRGEGGGAVQRRRGGGRSACDSIPTLCRGEGGGAQRAIPFQRCAEEKGGGRGAERAIPFQRCAEEKRGGGGLSVRFHSNAVQRRRGGEGGLACDSIPTLCRGEGGGGLSVRFHSNAVQRRRGGGAQRAIPFQRCAEEKGGGLSVRFHSNAVQRRRGGGGGLSVRFHSNAVQRRRGGGRSACDSIPTLCRGEGVGGRSACGAPGGGGISGGNTALSLPAKGPWRGGGGWHKASVSDCLPLAAPIGPSPPLILTLCGPERVLVVSTEPPDDLSCWTTPGVGRPRDGAVARAGDQGHPDAPSEAMRGFADSSTDSCAGVCICRIMFLTGASNNHNDSFPVVLVHGGGGEGGDRGYPEFGPGAAAIG